MSATPGPLAGVRVLDMSGAIAGPLAGMLLADQGAEVIRVAPEAGPTPVDDVHAVLDRGKVRIAADLAEPRDRNRVLALMSNADIVLLDTTPGAEASTVLRLDDIRAVSARAICVSFPGTLNGDDLLGDAEAYEGIVAAATAQFTNIHAARQTFGLDPVYTALPLASVYAGVHGATAAVLALRRGMGGSIEAPLVNAALSAMSSLHLNVEHQPARYDAPRLPPALRRWVLPVMRSWARMGGARTQAALLKIARQSYPALMRSYACADGRLLYLFAVDNAKLARRTLEALGLLAAVERGGFVFADPYVAGDRRDNLAESSNLSRKRQARLAALIAAALRARPAAEWEAQLSAAGIPCAIQRSTAEWLRLSELREAGVIANVDDPVLGRMAQPGPQAIVRTDPSATCPPRPRRPETRLEDAVWSHMPLGGRRVVPGQAAAPGEWLRDLIVVDLCSMVAGPVAGRVFAEYGARVIKVEPPHPNHGPRLTCWYGLDVNQGKESVILDLKTAVGRDALARLLAKADLLLTNHSPSAMAALGLDDAGLRAINPSLIRCRIGAYNGLSDGPWAERPGYDPVLQAASGIMVRYGNEGEPELHAIASCVDALTGYSAAFGAAVALHAAQGGGAIAETSLAAAATLIQLPFAFDHASRAWSEPHGQSAMGTGPDYRIYRCKDGWVFIAAPDTPLRVIADALRVRSANPDDIGRTIAGCSCEEIVANLGAKRISAIRLQTLQSLAERPVGRDRWGVHLRRQHVPSLGEVVLAPGQQILADGALRALRPAEKVGASTVRLLAELGLDPGVALASGGAREEIAHDYLPS